jgi:hypothetical protein
VLLKQLSVFFKDKIIAFAEKLPWPQPPKLPAYPPLCNPLLLLLFRTFSSRTTTPRPIQPLFFAQEASQFTFTHPLAGVVHFTGLSSSALPQATVPTSLALENSCRVVTAFWTTIYIRMHEVTSKHHVAAP